MLTLRYPSRKAGHPARHNTECASAEVLWPVQAIAAFHRCEIPPVSQTFSDYKSVTILK